MPEISRELVYQRAYTENGRDSGKLDALANKCRIIGLLLEVFGTVTAAGGGAVASVALDAPLSLVNLTIKRGGKPFVDGRLSDLYRTMHGLTGQLPERTASTPGAGATGNVRAYVLLPLDNAGPFSIPGISGWDTRDKRDIQYEVRFGALTDYAATNVASLAVQFRITAIIEQSDKWVHHEKMRLFEPAFQILEGNVGSAQADQVQNLTQDQFIKALHIMSVDRALVGQAQMVDGLINQVGLSINNNIYKVGPKYPWKAIQQEGWMRARIPAAERQAGCAMLHLELNSMDAGEWLKLYGNTDVAAVRMDSAAAPDGDVTAITEDSQTDYRIMQVAMDATPALWTEIRTGQYLPRSLVAPGTNLQ